MFTIPTEAVSQAVRDVATSQIVQSAIGTILGLAVIAIAPAVIEQMMRAPTAAWTYFRTPAAPIIDGTARPAA